MSPRAPRRGWSAPYRPRALLITAIVLTVSMVAVCALGWFSLPLEIRELFNDFQIVTLIFIAGVGVGAVWAMAVSTVRTGPEGLRIRNAFRTHTLAWSEIRAIRYRPGEPWAAVTLHRADTEGVYGRRAMMALQRVDGDTTMGRVRELARLLRAHTTD